MNKLLKAAKLFMPVLMAKIKGRYIPWYVQIYVTERCNLDCKYCFVHLSKGVVEQKEMSLAKMKTVIDDLCKMGTRYICLLGGEPSIRSDIGEIIGHIKSKGMFCEMISNGVVTGNIADKLTKLDKLIISYEGEEKHHDLDRGKGTHKKILESIKKLQAAGVKLRLNFTMTKNNVNEIGHVADFSRSLGIGLSVAECMTDICPELAVTKNESGQFWGTVKTLKQTGYPIEKSTSSINSMISAPSWLTHSAILKKDEVPAQYKYIPCQFGKFVALVDPYGNMYPCVKQYGKYGINIFEYGIKNAFKYINKIPCTLCRGGLECNTGHLFYWKDLSAIKEAVMSYLRSNK